MDALEDAVHSWVTPVMCCLFFFLWLVVFSDSLTGRLCSSSCGHGGEVFRVYLCVVIPYGVDASPYFFVSKFFFLCLSAPPFFRGANAGNEIYTTPKLVSTPSLPSLLPHARTMLCERDQTSSHTHSSLSIHTYPHSRPHMSLFSTPPPFFSLPHPAPPRPRALNRSTVSPCKTNITTGQDEDLDGDERHQHRHRHNNNGSGLSPDGGSGGGGGGRGERRAHPHAYADEPDDMSRETPSYLQQGRGAYGSGGAAAADLHHRSGGSAYPPPPPQGGEMDGPGANGLSAVDARTAASLASRTRLASGGTTRPEAGAGLSAGQAAAAAAAALRRGPTPGSHSLPSMVLVPLEALKAHRRVPRSSDRK